ncbi:hypothetical protein FHG87_000554 [Trinorchestia longiramus]|nr:hypothetical protein FHG87_000554 [Trinorchestia longiramus]
MPTWGAVRELVNTEEKDEKVEEEEEEKEEEEGGEVEKRRKRRRTSQRLLNMIFCSLQWVTLSTAGIISSNDVFSLLEDLMPGLLNLLPTPANP